MIAKVKFLIGLILIPTLLISQESCREKTQKSAEIQLIENLEDFAKIYGIVRYFHPSDEASSIDWNAFAAYGVGQIMEIKDQGNFEQELLDMFSIVAPSISTNKSTFSWDTSRQERVFWEHSGLGEHIEKKTYRSIRINKDIKESFRAVGTSIFQSFPKETRIKLLYEAKSESGKAYGYINIFGKNKEKLFFKNHQQTPVK